MDVGAAILYTCWPSCKHFFDCLVYAKPKRTQRFKIDKYEIIWLIKYFTLFFLRKLDTQVQYNVIFNHSDPQLNIQSQVRDSTSNLCTNLTTIWVEEWVLWGTIFGDLGPELRHCRPKLIIQKSEKYKRVSLVTTLHLLRKRLNFANLCSSLNLS